MAAARWDVVWERGGAWRRRLVRHDLNGAALGIGAPCVMELRGPDEPSSRAATLILTATIADGSATFTATAAQIEALLNDRYQHRVLITDVVAGLPVVLLRGWVQIVDGVGG